MSAGEPSYGGSYGPTAAVAVSGGGPFRDDKWVAATPARLGLQNTLRDPWRPPKKDKAVPQPESPALAIRK